MQTGAEANDANDDANDDHGDATSFVCERSPQYVTELVKLVKKCEPMVGLDHNSGKCFRG